MNERTKGWPDRRVMLGAGVLVLLALAWVVLPALAPAGLEAARAEGGEKMHVSRGVSRAMLATRLALLGEKQHSPILMLAAAELVAGGVKHAPEGGKEFHMEGEGVKEESVQLKVSYLVDRAKALAKDDADLSALVQKRAEQLTSRGLDPRYAKELPEGPTIEGKIFTKFLGAGKIPANGTATIKDIPFVANKVGLIVAVGPDHQENLVLEVKDDDGRMIENPPSVKSPFIALWMPSKNQTVTATVHNNGPEQVVGLLANYEKE
jgi:hypothetical protein